MDVAGLATVGGFFIAVGGAVGVPLIVRQNTKELRMNGGGHLADVIHRIEKKIDDHLVSAAREAGAFEARLNLLEVRKPPTV